MLAQLFQNLISNSIKFRGGERRENPCLAGKRRGRMGVLSVRDNGIGIEPQDAGRVFGMF